jgi:hypothetical protein
MLEVIELSKAWECPNPVSPLLVHGKTEHERELPAVFCCFKRAPNDG